MKKINLLIPALVAVTASPFIGLTSCFETEGGGDKPEPTPPIPEDAIVLDQWDSDFMGFYNPEEEEEEEFIVTGGILTKTTKSYESNVGYLFAIEFQHKDDFLTQNPWLYEFCPSLDGKTPSNHVFNFSDVEICVNTIDNKLLPDIDYRADDDGEIWFYYGDSQKVKNIKDGDIIYIKTKLNPMEWADQCYFVFYPEPGFYNNFNS